jgi:hypothetical protein
MNSVGGAVFLFALRIASLGKSYGLPDLANIGYYHRAMDRRVVRFEHG